MALGDAAVLAVHQSHTKVLLKPIGDGRPVQRQRALIARQVPVARGEVELLVRVAVSTEDADGREVEKAARGAALVAVPAVRVLAHGLALHSACVREGTGEKPTQYTCPSTRRTRRRRAAA